MGEYDKQARDFLKKTGTKITICFLRHDYHFEGEEVKRDIYQVVLEREERKFEFEFGQSVRCSETGEQPTPYDVLACLEKNEVGDFEEFCNNYGYDEDSKKAERIYHAVVNEWGNVQQLWSDKELVDLREIQ